MGRRFKETLLLTPFFLNAHCLNDKIFTLGQLFCKVRSSSKEKSELRKRPCSHGKFCAIFPSQGS